MIELIFVFSNLIVLLKCKYYQKNLHQWNILNQQMNRSKKYNTISLCFPKEMAYRVYDEFEASDIKEMENGDLIVTTEMPEDNWLIGYLLSFGTQVTVIEPAYLKKILSDEAKKYMKKIKHDIRCQGLTVTIWV